MPFSVSTSSSSSSPSLRRLQPSRQAFASKSAAAVVPKRAQEPGHQIVASNGDAIINNKRQQKPAAAASLAAFFAAVVVASSGAGPAGEEPGAAEIGERSRHRRGGRVRESIRFSRTPRPPPTFLSTISFSNHFSLQPLPRAQLPPPNSSPSILSLSLPLSLSLSLSSPAALGLESISIPALDKAVASTSAAASSSSSAPLSRQAAKLADADAAFESSELLRTLKERTAANSEANRKAITDKYCLRQSELGVGDCAGLRLIPGATKSGKQKTPKLLAKLIGKEEAIEAYNNNESNEAAIAAVEKMRKNVAP
jgi:hypothetical protein